MAERPFNVFDQFDAPVDPEVARSAIGSLPRPDQPIARYGELPYLPPLEDAPPQYTGEVRRYEPTLEDKARWGLQDLGVPQSQAQRAAAPVPYTPPGVAFEGGRDMAHGYEESDPGRIVAGAVKVGIAAAPMAALRAVDAGASAAVRGTQAIGQAIREAPGTAGGLIAGAATLTGAGEAGDDPLAKQGAVDKQRDADLVADARKQLEASSSQLNVLSGTAERLRGEITRFAKLPVKGADVAQAQEELNALGYNAGKADGNRDGPLTRSALERFAADKKTQLSEVQAQIKAANAAIPELRRRTSPQFLEDMEKVREAEAARRDILQNAPKTFREEYPNLTKNWFYAPLAGGAVAASFLRLPQAVQLRGQAQRWWEAVNQAQSGATPAARAKARVLAENLEKQMPAKTWQDIAKWYAGAAGAGAGLGAGTANIPEFYDYFVLPPDNPERRAYEEYIKLLPNDHPEIERTKELLKSIDKDNPAYQRAYRHFADIKPFVVKSLEGALEGTLGAEFVAGGAKAIAPFEASLPRAETLSLRKQQQIQLQDNQERLREKAKKEQRARARTSPAARGENRTSPQEQTPTPQQGQERPAPAEGASQPSVGGTPETWETPSGDVFKREGDRWRNKGKFSPPPPKGSKRLSLYDRMAYWAGYA